MNVSLEERRWMNEILEYLTKGTLLKKELHTRKVKTQDVRYTMIAG